MPTRRLAAAFVALAIGIPGSVAAWRQFGSRSGVEDPDGAAHDAASSGGMRGVPSAQRQHAPRAPAAQSERVATVESPGPANSDELIESIEAAADEAGPRNLPALRILVDRLTDAARNDAEVRSLLLPRLLSADREGRAASGAVIAAAIGRLPDATLISGLADSFAHLRNLTIRVTAVRSLAQDRHGSPRRPGQWRGDVGLVSMEAPAVESDAYRAMFEMGELAAAVTTGSRNEELGAVIDVLGFDLGGPRTAEVLELLLKVATQSSQSSLRTTAVRAISRSGCSDAIASLRTLSVSAAHEDVMNAALNSLAALGDEEATRRALTSIRTANSAELRLQSLRTLAAASAGPGTSPAVLDEIARELVTRLAPGQGAATHSVGVAAAGSLLSRKSVDRDLRLRLLESLDALVHATSTSSQVRRSIVSGIHLPDDPDHRVASLLSGVCRSRDLDAECRIAAADRLGDVARQFPEARLTLVQLEQEIRNANDPRDEDVVRALAAAIDSARGR